MDFEFKIDISKEIGKLITLKRRMNIPDDHYGSLYGISLPEQEQLATNGIIVNPSDIESADDYTLLYKGQRVILYIRDVMNYGYDNDPRFHIAMCKTLKDMFSNNRKHRYVLSQREDGIFPLYYGNNDKLTYKKLHVCQNCLKLLEYQGFSSHNPLKKQIVQNFTLTEFFIQYPKIPFAITGNYKTAHTAPRNKYPANWLNISTQFREKCQFTCEECGINLSANRQFLHVHHKDGNKANCNSSNLIALCIRCHANQPYHAHMKNLADYKEFTKRFP